MCGHNAVSCSQVIKINKIVPELDMAKEVNSRDGQQDIGKM
jgi:hypothetical protein